MKATTISTKGSEITRKWHLIDVKYWVGQRHR
jgi:hypothetical protein